MTPCLSRSVSMHKGREDSCLYKIVGRKVVKKVKAGEYERVTVHFA